MSKRVYSVGEGVPFVNGEKVQDNRRVSLSETEAFYDLMLGRISLLRKSKKTETPETGETSA